MRIAILCGAAAALLLAGCTTTKQPVSAAAQAVTFTEQQPGSECRLLGTVTGTQSNWLSGHGNEGQSMRGAENDLRNNTVAMGGNVVYGVTTPSENFWSSFAPLDTKMQGQAWRCP